LKIQRATITFQQSRLSGTGALEFKGKLRDATTVYGGRTRRWRALASPRAGRGNVTFTGFETTSPAQSTSNARPTLDLTDAAGNVNPDARTLRSNVGGWARNCNSSGVKRRQTPLFQQTTSHAHGRLARRELSPATVVGGTPTNTLNGTLNPRGPPATSSTGWNDKTLNIAGQITGPGRFDLR